MKTTEKDSSNLTIQFYNKLASEYGKKRITNPLFWMKEFTTFESLCHLGLRDEKIIDIGCGTGRDTKFFLDAGSNYVGIDASFKMLEIAQTDNPGANFQLMDFYNLPYEPRTFGGFWATASLLHVPRAGLQDVLQNLYYILKDKGIGFISIKEKEYREPQDGETICWEGLESDPLFPDHKRFFAYYDKESFSNHLIKSGFGIIRSYRKMEDDPKRLPWLCYFVKKV